MEDDAGRGERVPAVTTSSVAAMAATLIPTRRLAASATTPTRGGAMRNPVLPSHDTNAIPSPGRTPGRCPAAVNIAGYDDDVPSPTAAKPATAAATVSTRRAPVRPAAANPAPARATATKPN